MESVEVAQNIGQSAIGDNVFGNVGNDLQKLMRNPWISGGVVLALAVFAPLTVSASPKLKQFFQDTATRVVMYFLIAYLATRNMTTSLVVAVAYTIFQQNLNKIEFFGPVLQNQASPALALTGAGKKLVHANYYNPSTAGTQTREVTELTGPPGQGGRDILYCDNTGTLVQTGAANMIRQYRGPSVDVFNKCAVIPKAQRTGDLITQQIGNCSTIDTEVNRLHLEYTS